MANDCLVTKLKSSVANGALPKIGELPIKVLENGFFFVNPNNAVEVRSDGVATFTIEHQGAYVRDMVTVTNPGTVFLKHDYNIMTWIDTQVKTYTDISSFKYITSMERIMLRKETNNAPVDIVGLYNALPNLVRLILTNLQGSSAEYMNNIPSSTHGLDLATSRLTHIACSMNCIWTSRASSQNKLGSVQGINFGSYLTQFLIDMAACQGTSDRIYVYGTLSGTQEETTAINTLKSSATEFFINEINMKSA